MRHSACQNLLVIPWGQCDRNQPAVIGLPLAIRAGLCGWLLERTASPA